MRPLILITVFFLLGFQNLKARSINPSKLAEGGSYKLSGPWEFYWKKYVKLGDTSKPDAIFSKLNFWSFQKEHSYPLFGYGTYKYTITGLEDFSELLVLKVDFIGGAIAATVVADGKILAKTNDFDSFFENPPRVNMRSEALYFHSLNHQKIEVYLYLNSEYIAPGGINRAPKLIAAKQLRKEDTFTAALNFISLGVILALGSYSLVIYIRRKKDKLSFYIFILAFSIGLRSISLNMKFASLFGEAIHSIFIHLHFVTVTLGSYGLINYLRTLFFRTFFSRFVRYSSYFLIGVSIAAAITPIYLLTQLRILFEIIAFSVGVFCLTLTFLAAQRRKKDIVAFIISVALVFFGVVFDIFFAPSSSLDTFISPLMVSLFLLIQGLIVARVFNRTHDQVEKLNHQLAENEKARTIFFHTTSHELRTPINGIVGFLSLLFEEKYGQLPNIAKEKIGKALRLADTLKSQVNAILELSESKKNETQCDYQYFALKELTKNIDHLAEGLSLNNENSTYESSVDSLQDFFVGDFEKILQIARNLIGNAFKFSDPTRKNHIKFSIKEDEEGILLQVRDTGIGIAKENLSKIFDEFEQLENSSRRKYEGNGIGLTNVKNLASSMGGTVQVESHLNQGSSFTVWIPHHEPSSAPTKSTTKEIEFSEESLESYNPLSSDQAQRDIISFDHDWKILMIDDHKSNCEVVEDIFTNEGFGVHSAYSGKQGLELMRQIKPDIILLDMMMPEMSGEDVLNEIRKDDSFKALPVIVLTARANEEDRIQALSIGADDYLPKPIVIKELKLKVKNILERRRFYEEILNTYKEAQEAKNEKRGLESELKIANDQLIQAERMVLLGQLVAGIAHDMASPTQLIETIKYNLISNLESLEQKFFALVGEPDDPESQEVLAGFKKIFAELAQDIEELGIGNKRIKDLQRAIRNQSRNDEELVDIGIRDVIEECMIIINSKIKHWKYDLNVDESIAIEARRSQIGQVFTNLLSNSCDALKELGNSNNDVDIKVSAFYENDSVNIIFEDHGGGIPQDKIQDIFTNFYTTKPVGEGTGLGLPICQKIVENHHGRIEVSQSEQLGGAKFRIILPRIQPQQLSA